MTRNWFKHAVALLALVASAWTPSAQAQIPVPVSSQFDVTGFLQEAKINAGTDLLRGGTLKVNGQRIIVPRNLLVIFPANQLSWAQIFDQAPAPYARTQSGMALNDTPAPLASYEVHVVGNRVEKADGTVDYIAGLIDIAQQGLNSGAGYINWIDYAKGELRVGGILFDPNTGTRVQINDPQGRYGRVNSPDVRFTVDSENPTIRAETGYPMGLPAVTADPNGTHTDPVTHLVVNNTDDPLRPRTNRPRLGNPAFLFTTFVIAPGAPLTQWTMRDPGVAAVPGRDETDPMYEAPFEIGDYVTYSGTLVKDGPFGANDGPTVGPMPANPDNTFISAHTITASLSILTFPLTNPAYVAVDVTILGVGGITAAGLTEATARTRFEGFTTDPARIVRLYGMDVDCASGAVSDRPWGTIDIDQGPPLGAVTGRWRFRPPSKILSGPATGTFTPATRMLRVVINGGWAPPVGAALSPLSGNGLIYCQYQAPILEYLFPENVPGAPLPANNFETIPFLSCGSGPLAGGAAADVVGQLFPWPGSPAPAGSANLAKPFAVVTPSLATVVGGTTVTLTGSGIEPNGLTITGYSWSQPVGQTTTLSSTTGSSTTFTAPQVPFNGTPVTLTFNLTVTSLGGTSVPATATITVTGPATASTPVANAGVPQTVSGGATVTLNGTASSSPDTAPLTYAWTSLDAPPVVFTGGATTATPTFVAPTAAPGSQLVLTFQLVVNNGSNPSLPANTTVTVVGPTALPPFASAAAPSPVASDAIVILNGTGSTDGNGGTLGLNYLWESLDAPATVIATPTSASASVAAPHVGPSSPSVTLHFRLTVRNSLNLSSTALVSVVVSPATLLAPTITPAGPLSQTVASGVLTSLSGFSALDPNIPAQTPLVITWTQTSGPGVILANASTLNPTFTAPTIQAGQAPAVLNFRLDVVNKNGAGLKSSALSSVLVNPIADLVTITAVEYRTGKKRLTINVTDSVVSPTLNLTLIGQLNWTDTVLQNLGGGLYQVVLVGVEQPVAVKVTSALGGSAIAPPPPFRIRP